MVSNLVFCQLALIALGWLFLMLSWWWPSQTPPQQARFDIMVIWHFEHEQWKRHRDIWTPSMPAGNLGH